ncbi:uncharacterized protein LOC105833414 isoform X1 [Monomorium pharaonis]|uniref:uncharacterized protein LOC105833414 isoform X1 n=1 Tax=Monomorium pharaonis TaxID=307658 RepID=UPI00063F3074|nr:uncharacterized protein LOC105833414 isoform X1 [Monomorium pharaonis]
MMVIQIFFCFREMKFRDFNESKFHWCIGFLQFYFITIRHISRFHCVIIRWKRKWKLKIYKKGKNFRYRLQESDFINVRNVDTSLLSSPCKLTESRTTIWNAADCIFCEKLLYIEIREKLLYIDFSLGIILSYVFRNYYKKQATVTCIFTHCGGKFYYSIKAEDKFVDVYKKYISEL